MEKFYRGDEYLEQANRIKRDALAGLDSESPGYEISEVEAMRKTRIRLRDLLSEYVPPDSALAKTLAAHIDKEHESLAGEDGMHLTAAYINLLNGEYDEQATPASHRPRVEFVESLLQEHADALESDQATYLKSYLGRMKGVS